MGGEWSKNISVHQTLNAMLDGKCTMVREIGSLCCMGCIIQQGRQRLSMGLRYIGYYGRAYVL